MQKGRKIKKIIFLLIIIIILFMVLLNKIITVKNTFSRIDVDSIGYENSEKPIWHNKRVRK